MSVKKLVGRRMARLGKLLKNVQHRRQKTTLQEKRKRRTGSGNTVVKMREMGLKWSKKKRRQVSSIQVDDGYCSLYLSIWTSNMIVPVMSCMFKWLLFTILCTVPVSCWVCLIFITMFYFQWTKLQRSHRRMKITQFPKVWYFFCKFEWHHH